MRYATDTSVAVPRLMATHPDHSLVARWCQQHDLLLSGHAIAETYSVLTRLADDARLTPEDASVAIERAFPEVVRPSARTWDRLPHRLADADVAGGAVYDALVALAAREADLALATRDLRASATYHRLGVEVVLVR